MFYDKSNVFGEMAGVLKDVATERLNQYQKWGKQYHSHDRWAVLIGEEYGEYCQAIQQDEEWSKETDAHDKEGELIQIAALCVQAVEQIREERKYRDAKAGRFKN
jgi:hypothetical protein